MNAYLLRHAIDNIWCNPGQDRQYVYRLARLSPRYGVQGTINLFYERVPLPTQTDRYHIYQLGQVNHSQLGLPKKLRNWVTLAQLAEERQLFTDLYLSNGIQFPRFDSYVWLTHGNNFIVAVKLNDRIHPLEDEALYLRFYSNAYYQSARSDGRRHLLVRGLHVKTENELLLFQRQMLDEMEAYGSYNYCYVNGRFVHDISLTTAGIGDTVEYVLDSAIKRVVEFPIAGLPRFHSSLDQGWKYILHYDDPSVTTIEYLDDVDIYLVKPGIQDRYTGVYYHHNETDWLRMLTHKDYSIPIERLTGFVVNHPTDPRHLIDPSRWAEDKWTNLNELRLRLYIRHSGYERPLVPDAHRILELYRLPSADIVRAMTGDDATLDLWRAENLERSPYVRFMSAKPEEVYPIAYNRDAELGEVAKSTQALVAEAYGYHGAATVLAASPKTVTVRNGQGEAELAYEHWENATVFEYDEAGKLLGFYHHQRGQRYLTRNPACRRIEAITGTGGVRTNSRFGNTPVELTPGHNFRLYVSPMWQGEPTGAWEDITDRADLAEFGYLDDVSTPHRWVWTCDPSRWYGLVRQDDRFYCETFRMDRHRGVLSLTVSSEEQHHGVWDRRPMEVPIGQLDIFLNGRSLVEGLDYIVQWPKVVITNLEYLRPGDAVQDLVVRGYSFCKPNLERLETSTWGFVEHGVLSNDHRYDLYTHKVLRIVVDGHYHDPKDIVFDEDRNEARIEVERNGAPYFIQAPPIVFRDVFPSDLRAREEDDVRDRAVSDYLTNKIPPRERSEPDFIERPYRVHSVFSSKILHDLKNGVLAPAGITDHYSEHDIRQWCKDYEWLLAYDICNQEYDKAHIKVYPHWFDEPVTLDIYQYRFYQRILKTYLRYPPDTAVFVKMQ